VRVDLRHRCSYELPLDGVKAKYNENIFVQSNKFLFSLSKIKKCEVAWAIWLVKQMTYKLQNGGKLTPNHWIVSLILSTTVSADFGDLRVHFYVSCR